MVTCGCCAECEELKAPGPGRRAPPLFRDRGRGHWGRRLPRPPPLDSSPRREEPLPGCAARAGTRQSRGQPRAGVLLGLSGEAWTAGMRGGPLFSEGSGTGGSWRKGCTPSGVRPPPGPSTYPAPHPPVVTAATGSLGAGPARPAPPRTRPRPRPGRPRPHCPQSPNRRRASRPLPGSQPPCPSLWSVHPFVPTSLTPTASRPAGWACPGPPAVTKVPPVGANRGSRESCPGPA